MDEIIVFDTETTIDETQKFTFGSYRYGVRDNGRLVPLGEGLVYADDLPTTDPAGFKALEKYAERHHARVNMTYLGNREPDWKLHLISRKQFVERWIWKVGYLREATIVGFNLPFDLSRIAVSVGDARGSYTDGFSFQLWDYAMRPNLRIKHVDSKRSFIGWALSNVPGAPKFRGNFVDLRTAAFALTNASHSLASACEAFGAETVKYEAEEHGLVTSQYIQYNLNDVAATWSLYERVCKEYELHPIDTPLNRVYSPATLAKGYYRAMGITPPLEKFTLDDEIYGKVMSTFFGGRAENTIRKLKVPVTLLDFTSMYPTVNALMGLWSLLTAQDVKVVDTTSHVRALLNTIGLDDCFERDVWPRFVGIAKIRPDGDILPVRSQYGSDSTYNIGVNHLTYDGELWYAIPDLVASKLLTGKSPEILEAITFEAVGTDTHLRSVKLRGDTPIDPRGADFFTWVIEERARVRHSNPPLGDFLKVLANAGSYGIFAEMVRDDSAAETSVDIFSGPDSPWKARVRHPERPGKYAFPPVATCITAAARLMLAMLERCVTDNGGSWAFCDTDSMAIVTEHPGFDHPDIKGLDRWTVDYIRTRFDQLSPYDPSTIGHLLKNEFEGWCYGISSKRYALFDDYGTVAKYSEHGLGHLRGPNREWKRDIWGNIVNGYALPWLDTPALSQWSVSTPRLYHTLARWNEGKKYHDQIKPFNFLSAVYVRKEHKPRLPKSVKGFQLITGYLGDNNPFDAEWLNKYDPNGPTYKVTSRMELFSADVKVVTYADVLNDYVIHPESKFDGINGEACGPHTVGQLYRCHVHLAGLDYIGKESNKIEEAEQGQFDLWDIQVIVKASDQQWDGMRDTIFRVLSRYRDIENARLVGMSRQEYLRVKQGKVRPHNTARSALIDMAVESACLDLGRNQRTIKDARTLLTEWKISQ